VTYRCHCGRFLANVEATVDADHNIKKVEGHCSKHGLVVVTSWVWEDFFPEPHGVKESRGDGC
jgi:hypothetical protein